MSQEYKNGLVIQKYGKDNESAFRTELEQEYKINGPLQVTLTDGINGFDKIVLNLDKEGGEDEKRIETLLKVSHSQCSNMFYNMSRLPDSLEWDDVIRYNDTQYTQNFSYMFGNPNLSWQGGNHGFRNFPNINTHSGTSFENMYSDITGPAHVDWPEAFDVTNANSLRYMFSNSNSLINCPHFIYNANYKLPRYVSCMFQNSSIRSYSEEVSTLISNALDPYAVFSGCYYLSNAADLHFDSGVINLDIHDLFFNCRSLVRAPMITWNSSSYPTAYRVFMGCSNLSYVPNINMKNVENSSASNFFNGCANLKTVLLTNIGCDLKLNVSTKFERADLNVVISNLVPQTSTATFTFGTTNLGKLTEDDIKVATEKGWTLA